MLVAILLVLLLLIELFIFNEYNFPDRTSEAPLCGGCFEKHQVY